MQDHKIFNDNNLTRLETIANKHYNLYNNTSENLRENMEVKSKYNIHACIQNLLHLSTSLI